MEVVVEAVSLCKRFGFDWALRDVNLRLEKGLHLLMGPNGSGKTTFLKLAVGMLKPTSGSIRVFGLDPWRDFGKLAGRVSVMFEGTPLPWWLTGVEFAEQVLRARRRSAIAEELFSSLAIEEYWERYTFTYSSGMKKRLQLAVALGLEADLYVLDEPFTLLDEQSLEVVTRFISELSSNATILIATHFVPKSIEEIAGSIVRFHNGRIIGIDRVSKCN